MRPISLTTALYACDGMGGFGHRAERFDDGLVHNHHWAVSAEEAYPCSRQAAHGQYGESHHGERVATSNASWLGGPRLGRPGLGGPGLGGPGLQGPGGRGPGETRQASDHDDGLVHNHHWAVTAR